MSLTELACQRQDDKTPTSPMTDLPQKCDVPLLASLFRGGWGGYGPVPKASSHHLNSRSLPRVKRWDPVPFGIDHIPKNLRA